MNNVHEDAPEVFQTRWTLSYLRGPLTRTQIKTLMDPRRTEPSRLRTVTSSARHSALSPQHCKARPMLLPMFHSILSRCGQAKPRRERR